MKNARATMTKILAAFCLCALLLSQKSVPAQTASTGPQAAAEIPQFILAGLQAYKNRGPEDAVQAWIKGSAIEGNRDALTQANNLREVQDYYGSYRDYEVVSIHDLTSRTRVVYLVLNFDKGPLFAKFVAYRPDQVWILANFNFNTKEEVILPTAIRAR